MRSAIPLSSYLYLHNSDRYCHIWAAARCRNANVPYLCDIGLTWSVEGAEKPEWPVS
jgi:hypothetical protein